MFDPLPSEALSEILLELEVRALTVGSTVLGSQLGVLINEALAPKTTKDFGGLRSIVQDQLADFVRLVTPVGEVNDFTYEILTSNLVNRKPLRSPQDSRETSGADLWRFFSNPKLDCAVAATETGAVVVSPSGVPTPPQSNLLRRMEAQEYQEWARDFAAEHLIQLAYESASNTADFYKAWIPTLRMLSTPSSNFLKLWEILRTEKVASRLTQELEQAGVVSTRIAEIVRLARPVARSPRAALPTLKSTLEQQYAGQIALSSKRHGVAEVAATDIPLDELAKTRQMLHRAIDVMSLVDLQSIKISAGTWLQVMEKPLK